MFLLPLVVLVASIALDLSEQSQYAGLTFNTRCGPNTRCITLTPAPSDWFPESTTAEPAPPTPDQPVPLKSISVHATVRAWAYDVTSTLNYVNNYNQTIECQFVFPIPDNAAVYKFEATIAGRVLRAEIRNRTEAEQTYQNAVDSGQQAAILESQEGSPDVYRIKLGNLPPNETAIVKVGFAQPMERDPETGTLSITLPVVLNPRYVPRHELESGDPLKGNYFPNVPYVAVSQIRYTMNFSASIDMGIGACQITGIQSGNVTDILATSMGQDKRTANVKLTSNFSQDHDFRIFINVTQQMIPTVYVEPKSRDLPVGSGVSSWLSNDVAAAWFEPVETSAPVDSNNEYWIVVDRSGSMSGEKIQNAGTALALLLKSLPLGCRFNVIGFGSNYAPLFSDSTEYSETSMTSAVQYANALDADFGGTEILEPMRFIYSKPAPKGTSKRFIIIMTDGEVSNTNEVINLARRNAATTRVFAIGIGEGASTALINGVTRVSNGLAEYVRHESDRLQPKVIGILKATTMPSAENVSLSWPLKGGVMTMAMPNSSALPLAAFRGRSIMQYVAFQRQSNGDLIGAANLQATFAGTPISLQVPFNISNKIFSAIDDPMPLHRLAAKARLVELTDSYYSTLNNNVKKEIIAISIATGVLSEFTAIVAIDPSGKPANDSTGKPLFVNIERPTVYDMNSMFPSGGMGRVPSPYSSFGGSVSWAVMPSMSLPVPSSYYSSSFGSRIVSPSTGPINSQAGPMGSSSWGSSWSSWAVPTSSWSSSWSAFLPTMLPPSPPFFTTTMSWLPTMAYFTTATAPPMPAGGDAMDFLVQLQKFAGSWAMSDAFVAAVAAPNITTVATLTISAKTATVVKAPQANDETIATLIGVAVLRTRYASRRAEWQFIEGKALNYLRQPGRNVNSVDIDSIVTAIATALKL